MTRKSRLVFQLLLALMPNFIKIPAYRVFFDAEIGRGVRIGFGALMLFDTLKIGDGSRISPMCLIRVRHMRIGLRTKIGIFTRIIVHTVDLGPSVTIGPQVSIQASDRDPRCVFVAGAETWIFEYCYINVARPVRLGRNVGVGGGTYIFTHGLWLSKLKGYPVGFGAVTIGDDVWLPWGCFIMPGVDVGHGAVVGARSLVTKSVPAGALVGGSPAKILRDRVAVPPTLEEQVEMLVDATREYCELQGSELSIESDGQWRLLRIDGNPEVLLSTVPGVSHVNNNFSTALHVVHEPLKQLSVLAPAAYSLASFQCTPRSSFSVVQAAWLQYLRQIGTRHYPIDEVDVESEIPH